MMGVHAALFRLQPSQPCTEQRSQPAASRRTMFHEAKPRSKRPLTRSMPQCSAQRRGRAFTWSRPNVTAASSVNQHSSQTTNRLQSKADRLRQLLADPDILQAGSPHLLTAFVWHAATTRCHKSIGVRTACDGAHCWRDRMDTFSFPRRRQHAMMA